MVLNKLKLGIVDSSAGNGHMFSFSSLFNGYEVSELQKCPFPVIANYLPKHATPVAVLREKAEISAVWMRDSEYAEKVARFGKIETVFKNLDLLIESVDGIIITNDEPVGRESVLDRCLTSGKMIFLDKMIARTPEELSNQLLKQCYPGQLYCASSMSFSKALKGISWSSNTKKIVFSSPKNWANYGIHVVDAFLAFAASNTLDYQIGALIHDEKISERQLSVFSKQFGKNGQIFLRTEGTAVANFSITIWNDEGPREIIISDPFETFADMLSTWLSRDPITAHLSEYKRYAEAVMILGSDQN